MNRGARHQMVFLDDTDRNMFLFLLEHVCERHRVEIHSYCLMGNHYHLLVRCPEGTLSQALQYLGSVYTQRFNRKHGTDGALFRGRFLSKAIETEQYLLAVARYIPRNPLPIVGDQRFDSYTWSSHRAYIGLEQRPHWLKTSTVLDMFGNRIDRYQSFVLGAESPESDATILNDLQCTQWKAGQPITTNANAPSHTKNLGVRPGV